MKTRKITRVGSGRTKGSVSFVTVLLRDLCSKIADPNTPIKVSRLQMEAMGFIVKPNDPQAVNITESSAQKTTLVVTDLDSTETKSVNS